MELKDTVVGRTDESGVTLPPLHPRCRCAIMYREVKDEEKKPRGLAAGNAIYFNEGGKSPYKIGAIDFNDAAQVKQVLDWTEARIVTAPVENAIIITRTGDIYHCTGGLNSLETIEELGERLIGSIVTHNHPLGSDNGYSFSFKDRMLFTNYKLARLRGIDERFIYEMNRNPADLDDGMAAVADETFLAHFINIKHAKSFGYGYRRWLR